MSYVNKKTQPLINLKLTNIGRKNLANGGLNFKYFSLGDSEMNYSTNRVVEQNILRPVDDNSDVQYKVAKNGTNYTNSIDSIYAIPSILRATADERGFFANYNGVRKVLNTGLTEFSGLKIAFDQFDGTNTLICTVDNDTQVKSDSSVIETNDYLLVKIIKGNNIDTTDPLAIDDNPYLYFWYLIASATTDDNITYTLSLDRELPDLHLISGSTISHGYLYKGGKVVANFDEEYPTAYWSAGLLDFTSNNTNVAADVPLWNFNIYHVQDIIGVDSLSFKGKNLTEGELFSGIYSYLGYAETAEIQKIGIIHYTNNTVSNFYGEGFYEDTLELHLPTLMWHKKEFNGVSSATDIGYTFVCDSTFKLMGTDLAYYDLIDQETTPTVVGKVFINQKVVIIEDPELLTAMSLKSNRNFTLPQPKLTLTAPGLCNGSSQLGSIKPNQKMCVTYMFGSKSEGIWYQPCENFATITNNSEEQTPKDVLFNFDNTIVNNFAYLFKNNSAYGYAVDTVYILTQVLDLGEQPSPSGWKYFEATNYLGSNGCLNTKKVMTGTTEYNINTDTFIVTNANLTTYSLSDTPAGSVLVSINGVIQKEASNTAFIVYPSSTSTSDDGDYVYLTNNGSLFFGLDTTAHTLPTEHPATRLKAGDIIQVTYLVGNAEFGAMEQFILVPASLSNSGVIYLESGSIYIDLEEDPAGSVYAVYNGIVLSTSNYDVVSGGTNSYRVKLLFTPIGGSVITLFYGSATASSINLNNVIIKPSDFANLTVNINYDIINAFSGTVFKLDDYITLPSAYDTTSFMFGDENFFFGNLSTDIKATIYKTLFTINVLPNTFITSLNPTFNADNNKVAITEMGIYDSDYDLVAIGKFSQPLTRKSYADMLIIQASIDF